MISAAIFLGVLVGLPIGKVIILRRLKALSQRRLTTLTTCSMICFDASSDHLPICLPALYVGTLFLTLPESLGRLLQGLFVIILTIKVAQVIQGIAAYGIRKWTDRTAKEDPTSAAMLKNMTWLTRFMIWTATILFVFDNLGINVTAFVASLGSVAWLLPWLPNPCWETRSARSRSSWTSRSRLGTSSLWRSTRYRGARGIQDHTHPQPRRRAADFLQQRPDQQSDQKLQADARAAGGL